MRRPNMNVIGIAAFVILASAVIAPARAQVRRSWWPGDPGLDLTDDQYVQIQKIRLKFQEDILSLEARWRRLNLDLDELEWKGTDRAAIDAKIKEIEGIEAELDKKYLAHRDEIRSVLNKDQQAAFDRYGGLGMGPGPGWGAGMAPRWGMRYGGGRAWGPGMGRGLGRGCGPGMGRGYFCPWFRRW